MDELKLREKGKVPGPETGIEVRKSICTICDPMTQCCLDLFVKDGEIIRVEGSKEAPHSHGTLCAKGAATRQYVYSEERVKTPLRRVGERGEGAFERISWDEALDEIADRLNAIKAEHGAESVIFFAGYPKHFRAFLQRLSIDFGSPNYCTESSTCSTATIMAQKLTYGAPAAADMKTSRCCMLWACNPAAAKTLNMKSINRRRAEGMKLVVVDPRVTYMASRCDIHLQLRPGTDGALALAMANVIISESLYDRAFVAEWTHGFDRFAELAAEMTPERAERITGVDAALIREAARLYATSKPASILTSAAPVVHHTNGVQNYRAVFCLIGLTGNIDIHGGNMMNPPSVVHMVGGFPSREGAFTRASELDTLPERIGGTRFPVWNRLVTQAQACDIPRQIETQQPYPLKAAFCMGLNYRMFPDSQGFLEALCKLDFIVDVDLFLTDSAKYADIVLPACSSVERSELRCWPAGYVMLSQPAIEPVGEARSDFDIICELSKRLGLDDALLESGFEACIDWMLGPSELTVEELKKHPGGMWVPNPQFAPERKYLTRGFATPSGKLEFASEVLAQTEGEELEELPSYREPVLSPASAPDIAAEFPLVLSIGARKPMFQHSRMFRVPWIRQFATDPTCDINPADAARAHIVEGSAVDITTPYGSVSMKAHLTDTVREGDVHLYHDWPEANGNDLMAGDYLDPISGFPGYRSMLCKVTPSNAERKEA